MSRVEIKNLPSGFSVFSPDRIVYREGRLYLADRDAMRIAVIGTNGLLEEAYDIASLLEIEEKKKDDIDIVGFGVDGEGNMLFTIPVLFKAFRLSPDRKITGFGSPGSSPGKFNIVGGIARDDMGYYYVTDTLRSVVMIFDKDLNFQTEFGYRGFGRGNLFAPKNLALDARGRLYVSQLRDRGVSVFRITHN
jgi:DNA-binding beta-propeller fold protein YncE